MNRSCLTLLLLSGVCLLGCAESTSVVAPSQRQEPVSPLQQATQAWRRGDLSLARSSVKQALLVEPDNPVVFELAGDIERDAKDLPAAIAHYREAIKRNSLPSREVLDKVGRCQMSIGHPFAAVETLEHAVSVYPKDRVLRVDLVGLLLALGREPEAGPHLQWLILRGHGTLTLLSVASDLTRSQVDDEICRHALKHAPEDLRPEYSLARKNIFRREWAEAAATLRKVVANHPNFRIAQAYYVRAIVELEDQRAINEWRAKMPESMHLEPQYWKAIGIWAERHQQNEAAARSFLQACRLEPNDVEAHNQLAFALAKLNHSEEAQRVAKRAADLARVRELVDAIRAAPKESQATYVALAQTLDRLGRLWEAAAWLRGAAALTKNADPSLPSVYADIHRRITAKTVWQLPEAEVNQSLKALPIDSWAAIDWGASTDQTAAPSDVASSAAKAPSSIHFANVAKQTGLDHLCRIREPEDPRFGVWIYQVSHGGAAVLDYDMDGWPDMHLSVADGDPLKANSGPNRLYRNQQGMFTDVTENSLLSDSGFTQGFAVGDVNADGFDDVFVANIGKNRLYVNCGDGTFNEVSEAWGLSGESWTTSAILADINQDGLVDLFEVNYCAGDDPYNKACALDGIVNPCVPTAFSAERDAIWQGQPNGGFVEKTGQWIADTEPGRGFGAVAGLLDNMPGIDIYVANDMSANQFWSTSSRQSDAFSLQEQARVRGLAFDRRSLPQASMGIAAGDPDLDGDIDFYVTNFTGEYNTYYDQVSPGVWSDVSERNGHAKTTTPMLAFGTQFMDVDNDGTLELMVANGHVFNKGEEVPYRMPSQIMKRKTDGIWSELTRQAAGDFFAEKKLSRSLVTWDYNRDGRVDALMTHLFDPVSLLENQSDTLSRSIALSLKGTRSSPEAVGAIVELSIGDRKIQVQQLRGFGFQCSSQQSLHIGLGAVDQIDHLRVRWPSGREEDFGRLEGSGEYLLVEDEGVPFRYTR